MPIVNGNLTDFGLDAMAGHAPRLTFRAATPGVAGMNILSTKAVEAVPAANGFFSVALASTQTIAPATHYVVQLHWTDTEPTRKDRVETLPWKLFVPPEGGALGDLLRVPANPALVFTGNDAPFNPATGTWWLDPETGDLSESTQDGGAAWEHKANLRGPAGFNATGAAEDDAAVAAFIKETAGPTQTAAALTAAAADTAAGLAGMEVMEDFSTYPAGPLTTTKTGLPWEVWPATGTRAPRIVADPVNGNYLCFDPAGVSDPSNIAAYAGLLLADDVVRFGMEVSYGAWTSGGGVAAAAITDGFIGASYDANTGIPIMAAHLQTSPESWAYDVNSAQNTAVDNVGGGLHRGGNLASDGIVRHYWDVELNKADGTALVTLPSGKTVKVTDPTIKHAGRNVFWEPFMNGGAANKSVVRIHKVWATSRNYAGAVRALAQSGAAAQPFEFVRVSGADMVLTSTLQLVPGAVLRCVTPPTNSFLVEISGYIDLTADAIVSAWCCYEGGSGISYEAVTVKLNDAGKFFVTFDVAPGAAKPGYLRGLQVGFTSNNNGGVATLKLSSNPAVHRLSFKVYPRY